MKLANKKKPFQDAINSCKSCRLADICLPAKIGNEQLQQLHQLSFKAHLLTPGEHLYRQGEKIDYLFIIQSGLLKSYMIHQDGSEYIMGFYSPPSLLGWENIDEHQLTTSIVAVENSNVCEIPINKIELLVREIPHIEMQLLLLVSQRIMIDNNILMRTTASQRVANFLLQLSKNYHLLGYPSNYIKLPMSHQDIANYLRITPSTISRIFHKLEEQGIITITKHLIYLKKASVLRSMAGAF